MRTIDQDGFEDDGGSFPERRARALAQSERSTRANEFGKPEFVFQRALVVASILPAFVIAAVLAGGAGLVFWTILSDIIG